MKKQVWVTLGVACALLAAGTHPAAVHAAASTAVNATSVTPTQTSGWVQAKGTNAELYDNYTASKKALNSTLAAGSKVQYTATATVNGTKWYEIATNKWVSAEEVSETAADSSSSTNNAAATSSSSSQTTKTSSSKSSTTQKAATTTTTKKAAAPKVAAKPAKAATPAVKTTKYKATIYIAYVPGYGVRTAATPGGKTAGKYLKNGTAWKVNSVATVNGTLWYCLGTKNWLPATYASLSKTSSAVKYTNVELNIVRTSTKATVYNNALGNSGKTLKKGSVWKYTSKKVAGGLMWYAIGKNQWVRQGQVTEALPYQNPSKYFQISYTQIKPTGKVGYNIGYNYEGIKTWLVLGKLGLSRHYANMSWADVAAVKSFQRRHGLKATGVVDLKTWTKLGLSKSLWTSIDSYIQPLRTKWYSTRSEHIEAMIAAAYTYLGNPYIVGASTSAAYGNDCSGLVTQALYAAGINPLPVSSIQHAHPGNEWNSRILAASSKFKTVSYANRQRGDLIFYTSPYDHRVWHVAIYLGNNKVIESWPPKVMVASIKNSQRSWVTRVARVFN